MNKKEFTIEIKKVTDESLIAEACGVTIGKDVHPSTSRMFASEHSPIRTQLYFIRLKNIPLSSSTHFIRHGVGSQPYAHSFRPDRNKTVLVLSDYMKELNVWVDKMLKGEITKEEFGIGFEKTSELILSKTDRNTPTDLDLFINAQGLIDMAKLRLCNMSSKETIEIFKEVKKEIGNIEPKLEPFLVPKCVYRNGICSELKPCGYCETKAFDKAVAEYRKLFKVARELKKQII